MSGHQNCKAVRLNIAPALLSPGHSRCNGLCVTLTQLSGIAIPIRQALHWYGETMVENGRGCVCMWRECPLATRNLNPSRVVNVWLNKQSGEMDPCFTTNSQQENPDIWGTAGCDKWERWDWIEVLCWHKIIWFVGCVVGTFDFANFGCIRWLPFSCKKKSR